MLDYQHRMKLILGLIVLTLFAAGRGVALYAQGVDVPISLDVEGSIEFTADQSNFNLDFSNFTAGSISSTAVVTYTLSANNVSRMQDLILVRMETMFDGINVQADMGTYTLTEGNAHLVESQAGFADLTSSDTGIADKVADSGDGKILQGNFSVTYRALIQAEQPAGLQSATLVVSFVDN